MERRNYLLLCRIPKKYADEAAGELIQVLGRGKYSQESENVLNRRRGGPAADFCVSVRPGADAKKGWGTDEKNGKFRRNGHPEAYTCFRMKRS